MAAKSTTTTTKTVKKKKAAVKVISFNMADDPLRSRDWRWRRVKYLVAKIPGSNKMNKCAPFDCKDIRRGKAYLTARCKLQSNIPINPKRSGPNTDMDFVLMPLRNEWADILKAESIWEEAKFQRWVIEALVLANVSAEDIALEFGCSADIIKAYETYFYDVRGRLTNDLFIVGELLAPMIEADSSPEQDCDFFWKAVAYRGGATMVRPFFAYKKISDTVRQDIADFIDDMRYRNVAKASTARSVNHYNAHELMEEHIANRQIDENSKALTTTAEQMASGAKAMLGAISFAVASLKNVDESPIEERIGKTIKVLADDDKSVNNDKDGGEVISGGGADNVLPTNLMLTRLAAEDAVEADVKTSERVPESGSKSTVIPPQPPTPPPAVLVEALTSEEDARAEAVRSAKDTSVSKKNAALKRIKSKRGKKKK